MSIEFLEGKCPSCESGVRLPIPGGVGRLKEDMQREAIVKLLDKIDRMERSHLLNPRYPFGAVVYLKVRSEKVAGMVTGYFIRPQGWGYYVGWADGREGIHYEFELAGEYAPEWAARPDRADEDDR